MSKLSRKEFLKRSILASASLPLVGFPKEEPTNQLDIPDSNDLVSDEEFWADVRKQYTVDDYIVNLNNGSVGPQPKVVQDAHIDMYRISNLSPAYYMWKKVNKKRKELRFALAELLDCDHEEVAINRNTTEGLNTVTFGIDLKPGDEVVVSNFDYPFMLNAWRQREMRDGIVVKEIKLSLPLEEVELAVELFRKAITPKTKVVHVTHVQNWTGQIMPVKEITRMAQELGCEVVVDAAHSVGHVPVSFKDIGCDYLATSLHKWLGAPFGTGALIIKKEKKAKLWPLTSPYEPQGDDIEKFEFLGTRSIPAEMAALEAIEFHRKLGPENVHQRLHFIKNYWAEKVQGLNGLKLHTSLKAEFGGAIATISIDGLSAGDIARALWQEGKFHVGYIVWNGLEAVRISPHIYNSLEELDRLVVSIEKLTPTMIKHIIQWLAVHRAINLALICGYALFIVFAHDWFVQLSIETMEGLSLPVYDRVVAMISLGIGLGLILLVFLALRSNAVLDNVGLGFLLFTLVGLVIHFFMFTEMNIEFIHAMEFGLLTSLVYPLTKRYGAAMVWALPIMLVDEWYQFKILYPESVEYFDFNDIQLDMLGSGLLLSLTKTFKVGLKEKATALFKRPELYLTLSRIIVVMILLVTSLVVAYPELAVDHTLLVLNEIEEPYGFWRLHPDIGSTYHVHEPIHGLVTMFTLCLIYLAMDPISSSK